MRKIQRSYLFPVYLAVLLGLSGCASVDFDYPRDNSYALQDFEGTTLESIIDPYEDAHPGKSGFLLQTDGIDSLAARLVVTGMAQKTIDAQYYLITNDAIGHVFIGSLLQAADRGVRVRLLLDDIQTKGYDAGMAALDSHPNFEVRIFNPFAGRNMRIGDGVTSFSRINRRMHNKSFTVDNQITIIGGRNIADEYFGARSDVNFGDVDVMAVGPVVRDVSNMFDSYWNHRAAAPIPAFAKMPDDPAAELERLRKQIDMKIEEIRQSRYAEAVMKDFDSYTRANLDIFTWGDYELAYDSPDKVYKKVEREGEIQTITSKLREAIDASQEQVTIISPYFVPRKRGIEYLTELLDRDVEVIIITNSLAATNHDIVHSGYMSSRKPLLKKGAQIFEVRSTGGIDGLERGGAGASLATLHTKAFVVDCKDLFVGSFNWDPRSVRINTELGVIIDSEDMSKKVCDKIDDASKSKMYEVLLNNKGKLIWVDSSGEAPVTYTKEPDTSWWQRFKVNFQRILPIKEQL